MKKCALLPSWDPAAAAAAAEVERAGPPQHFICLHSSTADSRYTVPAAAAAAMNVKPVKVMMLSLFWGKNVTRFATPKKKGNSFQHCSVYPAFKIIMFNWNIIWILEGVFKLGINTALCQLYAKGVSSLEGFFSQLMQFYIGYTQLPAFT